MLPMGYQLATISYSSHYIGVQISLKATSGLLLVTLPTTLVYKSHIKATNGLLYVTLSNLIKDIAMGYYFFKSATLPQ